MVWGFILLLRLKNKNKVFFKKSKLLFSINEKCQTFLMFKLKMQFTKSF